MSRTVYNNLQESKSRRLIEGPVKIALLELCLKVGNEKLRLSPIVGDIVHSWERHSFLSVAKSQGSPNNGWVGARRGAQQ